MIDLKGQTFLITGIANERSLAYGIARQLRAAGAELIITYQNERLARRVQPLADSLQTQAVYQCDVTQPAELKTIVMQLQNQAIKLTGVVHAIAYAPTEALQGRLIDVSAEQFSATLQISVHSLLQLIAATEPLFDEHGGSVLTLSYYGGEKVIPGYHLMGLAKAALECAVRYLAVELGGKHIRVNAISAGPVKTLSSAAINNLRENMQLALQRSPLQQHITAEDVGNYAAFLCSDAARHITGSTCYVDSGLHILGA